VETASDKIMLKQRDAILPRCIMIESSGFDIRTRTWRRVRDVNVKSFTPRRVILRTELCADEAYRQIIEQQSCGST
jgi:hypothetical protein